MSKSKFYKLAESHGIEAEFKTGRINPRNKERIPFEITMDAPEGFIFAHNGCSVDCSIRGTIEHPKINWGSALSALKEIVNYGFEEEGLR